MPTLHQKDKHHQCAHARLLTTPSYHAVEAGYQSRTPQQLFTAATGSRKAIPQTNLQYQSHFPAPLVLPGDELAHDPRYPPQSFRSWLVEKERNTVTKQQRTVYVAAPPSVRDADGMMKDWDMPWVDSEMKALKKNKKKGEKLGPGQIARPRVEDVVAYLAAFFCGLPVKMLSEELEFTTATLTKGRKDSHINLRSEAEGFEPITTQIRTRELSPEASFSPYRHQINLNDMLDHAIAILPEDAYCLLLMVDHDMFEDEEDDFCCGRAYGGSRIAVVSSAQYNPAVDAFHGVDTLLETGHVWPGSHCQEYAEESCGGDVDVARKSENSQAKRLKRARHVELEEETGLMHVDVQDSLASDRSANNVVDAGTLISAKAVIGGKGVPEPSRLTPLEAALSVHRQQFQSSRKKFAVTDANLDSIYLQRVALTASHELLHCFGLDHCVYYACVMQGTASMLEDNRQPPYLCPVCENKLAWAVSNDSIGKVQSKSQHDWWNSKPLLDWRRKRNQAILRFCKVGKNDDPEFFASLAAWAERWLQMENESEQDRDWKP